MGRTFKIWFGPELKELFNQHPELNNLIKDFVAYKKGALLFNGDGIGYINARYVLGRDAPYDLPPVCVDNAYHIHALEKDSQDHIIAKRRYPKNQYKWTSNNALIYCTHWTESHKDEQDKSIFGILDFVTNAHVFNHSRKIELENLVEEFEQAVDRDIEVEKW
ncbi:hypothetical protein BTA51_05660 [Hahella sp. CCB-MM4]|uniref:type II toxin-antitoxin system YafO family toxin n=1 Tax=Hahella sp. (strain CCB-MM4) TaxID=1926491 RepID=UPI000B9A2465|nr:type II toxin-antitoxin system YafO family toxin [Hahella sp. CCB-MM4]OZG74489.1 hypothetical protein BTA51_05660 [Hahella sp. CCB-MM4]